MGNELKVTTVKYVMVPVGNIVVVDGFNARKEFGEDTEFEENIRQNGVLQPLLVRGSRTDEIFELIAGERRLRAARKVGLKRVPCIPKKMTDEEAVVKMISENNHKPLSSVEKAEGFYRLKEITGYSEAEVAKTMGCSLQHVKDLIAIHTSDAAQDALKNGISVSIAKEVAKTSDREEQKEIVKELIEEKEKGEKLTTKKGKKIVDKHKTPKRKRATGNGQMIEHEVMLALLEKMEVAEEKIDVNDANFLSKRSYSQGVLDTLRYTLGKEKKQPSYASFDEELDSLLADDL